MLIRQSMTITVSEPVRGWRRHRCFSKFVCFHRLKDHQIIDLKCILCMQKACSAYFDEGRTWRTWCKLQAANLNQDDSVQLQPGFSKIKFNFYLRLLSKQEANPSAETPEAKQMQGKGGPFDEFPKMVHTKGKENQRPNDKENVNDAKSLERGLVTWSCWFPMQT